MVTSDPTLVRLAVCNGIRNAIEAVAAANLAEPHPIVITWGETDIDYWVAVLDRGVGIVGPVEAALRSASPLNKAIADLVSLSHDKQSRR